MAAKFTFENLRFKEERKEGKDGQTEASVRVTFYNIYSCRLSSDDFSSIGWWKIGEDGKSIEFDASEKKAQNKFYLLLSKAFDSLVCTLNGKRTVYVHRNSGIPIIGEGVFGLIDRNTNCIEVKPLTSCNLDCVFCSVDAGPSSRKNVDFIVEEEYLVEEFNKLANAKQHDVEAHIGPQGEPLLYAPLVQLVSDLKKNPKVKVVSIDTNGTLLTRKLIDELAEAGLTRLNISLQSMDETKACQMAGRPYKVRYVLEMIDYASKKLNVLIAPVIIPGMNDDQVKGLIGVGKHIKSSYPTMGIQNFLNYKRGRNPAKQRSWEEFYKMLEQYEQEQGIKLHLCKEDFGIEADTKLSKPFNKKDVIKAPIVCEGPESDEKIASYKGRAIIVDKAGHIPVGKEARIEIIRDKHNVFRGIAK
ncbi:radical SAM protein [Candidatus Woesearchaeota archaeon]|nr:radical SAM protein [Candidatus Woesearchaeota archaeon]